MKSDNLHPLDKFWREKSGWYNEQAETPRDGVSEGKLAIDTWNAAIEEVAKQIIVDGNPAIALEKIKKLKY